MENKELIDSLATLVKNRNVILLGSAPGKHTLPKDLGIIASVNGSHKGFNLQHVDILFLNSWSLMGRIEIQKRVESTLASLTCSYCVYIDAAGLNNIPQVRCETLIHIKKEDRSALLSWASGEEYGNNASGNEVPSTGVTAFLILKNLGANVTLVGFSLEDGHSLLDGSVRGHRHEDAKYLPPNGSKLNV